ncbi:hypothetical protein HDU97_006311 [Phlyctochytrium planicorne]|nr:hypothetical protein HDU97_006311 [Phlyctochytrium planicorne]
MSKEREEKVSSPTRRPSWTEHIPFLTSTTARASSGRGEAPSTSAAALIQQSSSLGLHPIEEQGRTSNAFSSSDDDEVSVIYNNSTVFGTAAATDQQQQPHQLYTPLLLGEKRSSPSLSSKKDLKIADETDVCIDIPMKNVGYASSLTETDTVVGGYVKFANSPIPPQGRLDANTDEASGLRNRKSNGSSDGRQGKSSASGKSGRKQNSTNLQTPQQLAQQLIDEAAKPVTDQCALCGRYLPDPSPEDPEPWVTVRKLKPRLLREIRKLYPASPKLHPTSRLCRDEIRTLLSSRINHLLEEDQVQLSRLLDEAMRNLGEYEQQEPIWQKQFDAGWTFSEKAADLVARFGGSWKFIGCLLGFLAFWMGINVILDKVGSSPWDPFPFILLNLFLSSVAALQAPVIMMSQNRQAQVDRTVNDYVSKTVLRAEHQVRHVNAKVDHLLSHQWKRLLEFQEIQVDLIYSLQSEQKKMARKLQSLAAAAGSSAPPMTPYMTPALNPSIGASGAMPALVLPRGVNDHSPESAPWGIDVVPDAHAWVLMRHYLGLADDGGAEDDDIIFAHWHTDGDNYLGMIRNVHCELRASGSLRRFTYDMTFNDPSATLDDVLAGEGMVTLRNDFDLPHMRLLGRILRVEVHMKDRTSASFANGELPPRYKPSFFLQRIDKINDFWKAPITRLSITYAPPPQIAILTLGVNQRMRHIRADFVPAEDEGVVAPTHNAHTASGAGGTATTTSSAGLNPVPALIQQRNLSGTGLSSAKQFGETPENATLYMRQFDAEEVDRDDSDDDDVLPSSSEEDGTERRRLLLPIARTKAEPRPKPDNSWRTLASAEWRDDQDPARDYGNGIRPIRVWVEVDLVGPASFAFFCDEARVQLFGVVENSVTPTAE